MKTKFGNKVKGTLILESKVFQALHKELIAEFSKKYKLDPALIIDYQLYGFNNYNEKAPSIKKMVDEANHLFLNGKYLYNKWRQLVIGNQNIKLSREYSFAFFNCLRYNDIYDYIEKSPFIDKDDAKKQLDIIGKKNKTTNKSYYVGYYLGEKREIIKTTLTFDLNTKEVSWVLYYMETNKLVSFEFKAIIVDFNSNITVFFRKEQSQTKRDLYLSIYYGNENSTQKLFLKAVYAGYDINDRPTCGEAIFQKVENEEEQYHLATNNENVSPIIENYLLNKRIVVEHIIPQNTLEISNYGQYISVLNKTEGKYFGLIYTLSRQLHFLELNIKKNGAIVLKIDHSVSFTGFFHTDNYEYIFLSRVSNAEYDLKYSITLHASLDTGNYDFLTGFISGVFENHDTSCGKYCIVKDKRYNSDEFIKELDKFKKEDESFRYSDVFKKTLQKLNINLNDRDDFLPSLLKKENELIKLDSVLKKMEGSFSLLLHSAKKKPPLKMLLNIEISGKTTIKHEDYTYKGDIKLFASGVMAINITNCNQLDYYSQIMIFIGRHSRVSAKQFEGTANFLDEELRPISYKAIMIPNDDKEIPTM